MARPLPPPCPVCGYPLVPFDPESGAAAHCDHCDGEARALDGGTPAKRGPGFLLADVADGFLSLFRGAGQLFAHREYHGKLALAMAANFVLVVIFFLGLVWGFHSLIDWIDWSWAWEWVHSTALFLAWPLAVIAAWFLAPAVINAGMSVFLDPIAQVTERLLAGEKMKPVEIGIVRGAAAGIHAALRVLVLQIVILVPVLLLSLIPVVGWFFVAAGILVSAYLNSIVWFEVPVIRRGYGWRYRRQVVARNRARAVGFGLAFHLGLLIPFFNILLIGPAAAVATSALYFRFDKEAPAVRDALAGPPPLPAESA